MVAARRDRFFRCVNPVEDSGYGAGTTKSSAHGPGSADASHSSKEHQVMFVTVRKYRNVQGDRNHLIDLVKNGFVPLISKIDGFIDYYCFFADDDTLTSVNVYRDKRGADESVRVAAAWVEQNLAKFLPEPPGLISGEVFAEAHVEKQKAA
jgi:hypothetical protein